MQYQGCLLVVKDAQKSKIFYQELFGCAVELDLEDYVIFKEGIMLQQEGTWLGFIKRKEGSLTYQHLTAELYFEEENLDGFMERQSATEAIQIISPVTEHEWGQRSVRFFDPDGHLLEVGESMKVVVKRYLNNGMTVEEAAAKSMFPVSFVQACLEELKENAE